VQQLCFIDEPITQQVSGTTVSRKTACTQCTRPASRRPKTPASTLSAENHMQ